MPKPGQKTITIKEEIYKKAEDKAKEQGKSVAAFVTELILEKCKNQKEGAGSAWVLFLGLSSMFLVMAVEAEAGFLLMAGLLFALFVAEAELSVKTREE